MVDDDRGTKAEALVELQGRGYDFVDLALERTKDLTYWQEQGLTPNDLVCLDLKFIGYDFSGQDVFVKLQQGKKRGLLPGLEQVLVQTHLKAEVDPRQTSMWFATASEFKVYGCEKAVKATAGAHRERVVDPVPYALGLADTIDEIYRGTRPMLNQAFYQRE
jgi:hypothetical protein